MKFSQSTVVIYPYTQPFDLQTFVTSYTYCLIANYLPATVQYHVLITTLQEHKEHQNKFENENENLKAEIKLLKQTSQVFCNIV